MNIKILDSWLREYLKTTATPKKLAESLSLTSVSVEHIEKLADDYVYDIEVTTNRPELMSIMGLAREANASLSQHKEYAGTEFIEPSFRKNAGGEKLDVEIVNDPKLVNRICAVALSVNLGPSPKKIAERLESSDIRTINNVVDVTNYIMRLIGHPTHAFDLDRLTTKKLLIRESKKGEKIKTLDGQEHTLAGGDIVADDGTGKIVDLLGVMGTENSAIADTTKNVLFFIDNNDAKRIRKTSMGLGIRTEAATLNEKGIDPEFAMTALLAGIDLFCKIADAKVTSEIIDIYPNKPKSTTITTTEEKINSVVGIKIPLDTSVEILKSLGFEVSRSKLEIKATVPSWRLNDVAIEEDLIEEIVRIYGYSKVPDRLPAFETGESYNYPNDPFYWEKRIKSAFKYWGGIETYTYSMVSSDLFEGPLESAVTIKNPLSEDRIYMRRTLVPSLLEVCRDNSAYERLFLFELANVYLKKEGSLPDEKLKLAVVLKAPKVSFLEAKGIIEALFSDLRIKKISFKKPKSGAVGADVFIGNEFLGEIEQLEADLIDFELDFTTILKHVSLKKTYKPASKYPRAVEDLRFKIDELVQYEKIVNVIQEQSNLIQEVSLLDVYQDKKTFRIVYQSYDKNMTADDITELREKIISTLKKHFKAELA